MKYLLFLILIAALGACSKSDSKNALPGANIGPADSSKELHNYRYIGVLRSVGGYYDIGACNLDTSIIDTVYVTVLGHDSLRIRERFFSSNNVVNGVFPFYSDSTDIVLRADSSYYYHRQHYDDSVKLDGRAQSLYRNNYHATGCWGAMSSVFLGTKQ